MVRSKSTLFALSMCAALVSGTPTYATDASIGAITGFALFAPECFERRGPLIVNIFDPATKKCGTQVVGNNPEWIIPLLTPFTGHPYIVRVRASPGGPENALNPTTCDLFQINNESNSIDDIARKDTAGPGLQDLVFQEIYVLGISSDDRTKGGPSTLQVECVVGGQGGALLSVDLQNTDD